MLHEHSLWMRAGTMVLAAFMLISQNAHSQTWSSTNGPTRINAVTDLAAGKSGSVQRIYAADEGKLMFSTNGGATWNPTASANLGPIVVATRPNDFNWVITAKEGNAVQISTNGGNQWLNPNTFPELVPTRLAISPADPQRVFLGADTTKRGTQWTSSLWKSGDGGQSWQPDNYFRDNARPNIRDIMFQSNNAQRIWVSGTTPVPLSEGADFSLDADPQVTPTNGVWFSSNAGAAWERRVSGLPNKPNTMAMAMSMKTTDTLLFAAVRAGNSDSTRMHQSNNFGQTWSTPIALPGAIIEVRTLKVVPGFPDIIVGATDSGFLLSSNRGATWILRNTGLTNLDVRQVVLDLDNQFIVYAATPSSVFKSTNLGASWTLLAPVNTTIINTSSVTARSGKVFTSSQIISSVHRSTNAGVSWDNGTVLGNGKFIGVNIATHPSVNEPNYVYMCGELGVTATNSDAVIYTSTNGGQSWPSTPTFTVTSSGSNKERFHQVAADPKPTSQRVYAVGKTATTTSGYNFFWSTNKGASWDGTTQGRTIRSLGGADTALCIAVDASGYTTESQILYVGLAQFGLYKSTNAGNTWASIGGLNGKSVQAIALNHRTSQRVYVGAHVGFFRSDNSGSTFSNPSFANQNVKRLLLDPRYPLSADYLFATVRISGAPRDSVYWTSNGGTSWTNVTGSLPATIHDLRSDPAKSLRIYAATENGVYEGQLTFPSPIVVNSPVLGDWNMASVPVVVGDFSAQGTWPTATSAPSLYLPSGYVPVDVLANGPGYWVKFPVGQQPIGYTGGAITYMEIPVNQGWNIIGSISTALDTCAIVAVPAGNRRSEFFKFGPNYTPTDSLRPGGGYWVQVWNNGKFILDASVQCESGGGEGLAMYDRFTITDAEGKSQDLYVRNGDLSSSQEDIPMPPPPPDAEFDARFESGDFLRTVYPDSGVVDLNIEVDANAYPLTLSWEVRPENGITYSIGGGGLNKGAAALVGSGSQQFTSAHGNIIQLSGGSGERLDINTVPASFALHQNYPNPFNPVTTIRFDLPQDARVDLAVFDILGRRVATLADGTKEAGSHRATFNASGLSSGVYFYKLQAEPIGGTGSAFHDVKKLVLVR